MVTKKYCDDLKKEMSNKSVIGQETKDLARVDQLFERISTLIEQARRHVSSI